MSLIDPVLIYALDSTDNLTTDLIGSADATSSNVTITTDGTYGDAATFNGASSIIELTTSVPSALSGNASRTVSMWVNMNALGNTNIFTQGNSTGGGNFYWIKLGLNNNIRFESSVSGNNAVYSLGTISTDTWYNVVWTYNGSTTVAYVNGSQVGSISESLNTDTDLITIGGTPSSGNGPFLNGEMLDFRIYDQALNSTDVSTLFSTGPEAGLALSATMYTYAAELTWSIVPGASSYTLDMDGNTIVDGSSETAHTEYNLDDGTVYLFELYTDLDTVTPVLSESFSTPTSDITETGNLLTFISNDLTLISSGNVSEIDSFIHGNLVNGDSVQGRIEYNSSIIPEETMEYAENAGTILFSEPRISILTPFVSGDGVKQFDITKSDTLTETISYDGTNTITVEGVTYQAGDRFIFDGKAVKVAELN